MKGLMIKDFCIIKSRRRQFILIVALAAMYIAMGMGGFAISFLSLLGGAFGLSTLSYDAKSHDGEFIFTLPCTRKQYVTEKYLFIFLMMLCGLVIGIVAGLISNLMNAGSMPLDAVPLYALGGIAGSVIMLSLMIPVVIRFGTEQSQVAVFSVIASCVIVVVILSHLIPAKIINDLMLYATLLPLPVLVMAGSVVLLIVVMISYTISISMMMRKEF